MDTGTVAPGWGTYRGSHWGRGCPKTWGGHWGRWHWVGRPTGGHEGRGATARGGPATRPQGTQSCVCVCVSQRQAEDVVTVASKFKQRYECRLPPAAVRPPPDPQEEAQLYNGSGVAELLRPMAAAPCLLKTKDWWTYEFCYGKHIQQYHVEGDKAGGGVGAAHP
uniref:Endoplasmic reticulum lectin n=1 Tax=Calidris pygmaea TaxID=425635 RepID=A0A8C3JE79_9CHAR